jgi:hypothetical protein
MLPVTVATVAALLSGCTLAAPAPGGGVTAEATAQTGDAAASAPPRPQPTLDTDGSALQNLDYFDAVNQRLLDQRDAPDGRAFIDSLVTAGFDRSAMEVTPDRTAVDLAADSIQFSVRMGDHCLLGQSGNTGYVSAVGDVLSTGKCLVGRTRPIDW